MKKLLIFTFLLAVYSCQTEEHKIVKDYESLKRINSELNAEVQKYKYSIDSLLVAKSLDSLQLKIQSYSSEDCDHDWQALNLQFDSLQKKLEEKERNKAIIGNTLEASADFVLSKNSLIKSIFDNVDWENESRYDNIILTLSLMINPVTEGNWHTMEKPDVTYISKLSNPTNYNGYLHYLWDRFDKSPDNIKSFLSQENKRYMYALFRTNDLYAKSGLKNIMQSLLLSYEEIGTKKDVLDKLYQQSKKTHVIYDDTYVELASKEVKDLLGKNYSQYHSMNARSKYAWVYSFWVRRDLENNSQAVYELIKEFDDNMALEVGIEVEDEEYYEH